MGTWTRLKLIFSTKASSAMDRAEDPRQVLDYAYTQQQLLLVKLRQGLVEVATSKQQLERQSKKLEARVPQLEDQAKRALGAGRGELAELGMAVGRAEEKADRLQSRAKALDSLVDIGALEPAGGGDYVENELKRLTSGAEIDDELERLKAEIAAPRLPVQAGDGNHGS